MKEIILHTDALQGVKLMEIGLSSDTADLWLDTTDHQHFLPAGVTWAQWVKASDVNSFPSWSLGRLMAIYFFACKPKKGECPSLNIWYAEKAKDKNGFVQPMVDFIISVKDHLDFDRL